MNLYTYIAGQRIAVRVNGALYFLHSDHLGSTTLLTNQSQQVVDYLGYRPYGDTRYAMSALPTDRLFTGQRWDEALGLYDYRARYYDPLLGRFISADPVVPEPGNPQALNRYAYVFNNPLRYTDPDGHIAILASMGIGAAIGGIAMGVTYALTTDQFRWQECLTAAAVGAAAGALIGSGVGAVQGIAMIGGVAATAPMAATIAIGAGTGMMASGGGYMISNAVTRESFDTTDFLIASGVGAIEGGVSAIPGIGVGGRIAASGVAGVAESALSDYAHGREVDWKQAALSGGIGLAAGGVGEGARAIVGWIAGKAVASSGSGLGRPIREEAPVIDLTWAAVQSLRSYQELTRQATKEAQWQIARVAVRTTVRDMIFQAVQRVLEYRLR